MIDRAELRSDYLLVRRPHFHLSANALFHMTSALPRRQLSEPEIELWNSMQHPVTLQAARGTCGAGTDAIVGEFLRSGYCELVEPTFPDDRRRVLVIEPHADDAALSVGGTMWLRRRECAFVVATMASRSNHTRYPEQGFDYFDVNEITEVRRRESELFARMVGGVHVAAGLTDAALRYRDANWTLDFYRKHQMSIRAAVSRIPDDRERQPWTDAVRRLLTEHPSAEVWFPLGGPHADHMLTADACFAAFLANPSLISSRVLRVYKEFPYAARYPHQMNDVLKALRRSGADLQQEPVPIDAARQQKLRLASVYDSQEIEEMSTDTAASALTHGSASGPAELFWTVQQLPTRVASTGIVSAAFADEEQATTVTEWASKNKRADRLRVLLLTPSGRWASDLELLRAAFPNALLEVYAAGAAAAEVADVPSDRVVMRIVAMGPLAWMFLSLQFAAAIKAPPTLFHAGERRLRQARILSRLWRCDTLTVASMDPLVCALRVAR